MLREAKKAIQGNIYGGNMTNKTDRLKTVGNDHGRKKKDNMSNKFTSSSVARVAVYPNIDDSMVYEALSGYTNYDIRQ